MKKENVPQDDANVYDGKTKSIQYAVDKDGNYVQVKSIGLESANIVLELAWEEVNDEIKFAFEDVKNGIKSPVYYYMKKEIMDISILSESTGLPRWRIRRHLKPNVFLKLSDSILNLYKNVFNLDDIKELKELHLTKSPNHQITKSPN